MSKTVRLIYKNIAQRYRHKLIEGELKRSEINALSSSIILFSLVDPLMIDDISDDKEYQNIYCLLKRSKENCEISNDLLGLYKKKRDFVVDELKREKKKLILDIQLDNYESILRTNHSDKENIAKKLYDKCLEKVDDPSKEKIAIYDKQIYYLINPVIHLTPNIFEANVEGQDILKYYAYVIYDPKILVITELIKLDEKWSSFPLKWYVDLLTPSTITMLFDIYKKGEDLSPFFQKRYDPLPYDRLTDLMDKHYFQEISMRLEILREALDCYKDERYHACVVLMFTLIEGVLKDFSIKYDNKYRNLYKESSNYNTVLHKDGITESGYTIGSLLKLTLFGDNFDTDFISYFCEELYNERNPVLHGENKIFGTKQNAAKKIATLEYVLVIINNFIEEVLNEVIDGLISDKDVEQLIGGEITIDNIVGKIIESRSQ